MALSEQLTQDMKQAMKDKDKFKLSVIRMIRSAVRNKEIDNKKTLNDDEVLDILSRELKQRKDSLQEFEKAGRDDLVQDLHKEIAIIQEYMPEPLSDDQLEQLVQEAIASTRAASRADMGKVMGALMPKVKGRADGNAVKQWVQRHLQ